MIDVIRSSMLFDLLDALSQLLCLKRKKVDNTRNAQHSLFTLAWLGKFISSKSKSWFFNLSISHLDRFWRDPSPSCECDLKKEQTKSPSWLAESNIISDVYTTPNVMDERWTWNFSFQCSFLSNATTRRLAIVWGAIAFYKFSGEELNF